MTAEGLAGLTTELTPVELCWTLNPEARQLPFESGSRQRWVFELDDPYGKTQRLLVTAPVRATLLRFKAGAKLSVVFSELLAEGWTSDRLEDLRTVLLGKCAKGGLLIRDDSHDAAAPTQVRKPAYMMLMLQLLSAKVVNKLAKPISAIFSPACLWAGLAIIMFGQSLMIAALLSEERFVGLRSSEVLSSISISLAVVLLHELGHAAAAWRFGARKVTIGVGWYAVFPVAYADLSEIWTFSRRQRMLIDAAGVFMQGLAVSVLMITHYVTNNAVFLFASVAASLSILWNLNPLLRMDGYWLLSDLLGSTQLRVDAKQVLFSWWGSMRKKSASEPLHNIWTAKILGIYAIASSAFFVIVIAFSVRHFRDGILVSLPEYARRIFFASWKDLLWSDIVVLAGSAVWKLLVLVMIGRVLLQVGRNLRSHLLEIARRVRQWTGNAAS